MSVAIASSALSRRSRNAYRNSARIRSHGRGVTFHFGSYQYLITVISATSCARPIEVGTNRRHQPMFVIRRPMRSDFFAISVLSGPRPISAAEIHGCGSGIIRRRAARRVRGRARIAGGQPERDHAVMLTAASSARIRCQRKSPDHVSRMAANEPIQIFAA
jgi:hypothetical protein